jgi:hypothetical protein
LLESRELGCKVTGCGCATVLVIAFFALLMNFTESGLHYVATRKQQQQTTYDLPVLVQGMRQYAAAHQGKLPPLRDATEMKRSLFPAYVGLPDAFNRRGDDQPFQPNPRLSERKLDSISNQAAVVAAYEPSATGGDSPGRGEPTRAVVFLDGSVRRVGSEEWEALRQANRLP